MATSNILPNIPKYSGLFKASGLIFILLSSSWEDGLSLQGLLDPSLYLLDKALCHQRGPDASKTGKPGIHGGRGACLTEAQKKRC